MASSSSSTHPSTTSEGIAAMTTQPIQAKTTPAEEYSFTLEREEDGFLGVCLEASGTPNKPLEGSRSAFPYVVDMSEKHSSEYYVTPIAPAWVNRYLRKAYIPAQSSHYVVQPLTLSFQKPSGSPSKLWTPNTHPEGGLYFSFTMESTGLHVLTDANLYDSHIESQINGCLERVCALPNFAAVPPNADLVLDLFEQSEDSTTVQCGYYFVISGSRSVFWLEEFDVSPLLAEVRGACDPAHIKHEFESQYWKHCELFPANRSVDVDELRQILLHASGDILTSASSTSPYDSATLDTMLTLTNNMTPTAEASVALYGRLMSIFTHQRFLNFHGQPGARLDRDASVHHPSAAFNAPRGGWRGVADRATDGLLLGTAGGHVKALRTIWIDSMVNQVPWGEYVKGLESDWKDCGMYSAILLNASILFMLFLSNMGDTHFTAAVSTCFAIFACSASLLGSLLLSKRYSSKEMKQAESAVDLLSQWGPETLGTLHSIPYALLLWSLVSLAFSLFVSFPSFVKL